jgi:ribonuclease HI
VRVTIHADESCLGNGQKRPSPGGAAGLVVVEHDGQVHRRDYWISEPDTTNNRMAIRSAIEALRNLSRPCTVHFFSDSRYLVDAQSKWMRDWLRKGKLDRGDVANAELWKELNEVAARHDITWEWNRGHASIATNEYADHLARSADEQQTDSGGFVKSGFEAWLEAWQAKHRR